MKVPLFLPIPARFALLLWLSFTSAATSAEPELPYTLRRDVPVPMRDGTQLAANIFMPHGEGPFPVLLMRTPYGKPGDGFGEAARYAKLGIAFVAQDCRGKGASSGQWDPFKHDPQDGYDTQEWIGSQDWCNGRIATTGGSYVGWTQWASAPRASKYLKAMTPIVPFHDVYHDIAYPGGALQLSLVMGWGALVGGARLDPAQSQDVFSHLPLLRWGDQFEQNVPYLAHWIEHPTYDDYWKQRGIDGNYADITVPILNIGGWYDIFAPATLKMSQAVRDHSVSAQARENQYVIMGPWGHSPDRTELGDLAFGENAKLDLGAWQEKWVRHWLLDEDSGIAQWPPIYLYVMGRNAWRAEKEWPLARTQWTPWHLGGQSRANSVDGGGTLSLEKPSQAGKDSYVYDPNNPVPTRGGNNLIGAPIGPFDQSDLEKREDILVYTSKPLQKPLEITGPVKLVLYASSTAPDTDFTAKLLDVHPDGEAYNLCDGILRTRYRESKTKPTLTLPGKRYRYEIDLWVTSNEFQPGHRVRLEVSSSNFPRFDRNPNSGKPFGSDTKLLQATQVIYHGGEFASHLLLPVIPIP